MNIINKLITVVLVLFVSACSSVKVTTDYAPDSDFSNLKSYTWFKNDANSSKVDPRVGTPIMDARIRVAIDAQFKSQGFSKADKTADFIVNYSVTTKDKIDVRTYNLYGGYAPGWGWGAGIGYRGMVGQTETVVSEYTSGTLVIDIIDPKTNQLIWRGLASKRLPSTSTPEKMNELVNKVVEGILTKFPPQ